jgi:hypothetical protein
MFIGFSLSLPCNERRGYCQPPAPPAHCQPRCSESVSFLKASRALSIIADSSSPPSTFNLRMASQSSGKEVEDDGSFKTSVRLLAFAPRLFNSNLRCLPYLQDFGQASCHCDTNLIPSSVFSSGLNTEFCSIRTYVDFGLSDKCSIL